MQNSFPSASAITTWSGVPFACPPGSRPPSSRESRDRSGHARPPDLPWLTASAADLDAEVNAVLHNLGLGSFGERNTGSYTAGIGDRCAVIPLRFRNPEVRQPVRPAADASSRSVI
jgi:hypothetical protein